AGDVDQQRAEEEMGDLLFAIANLSRKLGIEPETALRKANDKFTRRFTSMESKIGNSSRAMRDMTLEELEPEWQRAKAAHPGKWEPCLSGTQKTRHEGMNRNPGPYRALHEIFKV